MQVNLKDKVIVVTGGYQSLGKYIVAKLVNKGAKVAVLDIKIAKHIDIRKHYDLKDHNNIRLYKADITDEEAVEEAILSIVKLWGRIDVLINNAAVFGVDDSDVEIEDINLEDYRKVYEVNTLGSLNVIKKVAPVMRLKGQGKIINIGTAQINKLNYKRLSYILSKESLLTITKTLAKKMGKHNVNVNMISPGLMAFDSQHYMKNKDDIISERFIKKDIFPEDVYQSILFLIGPAGDAMTGQHLILELVS
jgi:NAD(P)-dependent dehydrogenase (short-subunit alcohol dehydrogenase family)